MSSRHPSIATYGLRRWINERPWMNEPFEAGDYPTYDDWRNYRDNGNPLTGRPYSVSDLARIFKVSRDAIYKWVAYDTH